MLPSRPLEALKTSSIKVPFSSDDASSDLRGILTLFAHLIAFMPRGSARGDLNHTTNTSCLRRAPQGSDRPSSARENAHKTSDDASSDTRGTLTRFAHLLVFMPRGSARGDLNLATNIRGLRHTPRCSDRPSSARKPKQRSEAEWKVRSPAKTRTLARPEAPIREPWLINEAT